MTIEESDLELLIALQERPLASASTIAKAIKLSTPTVITRLDLLKQDKSYYSVCADLLPDTLDLEIIDVFIEIENIENLTYFENHICYNHPYTLFRIRCFGSFNGLFVQFRIPKSSHDILLDLLDYLKKENKIQNYFIPTIIPSALSIYTRANLKNWEPNMMRWNFDWKVWSKKLDTADSKRIQRSVKKSVISKFDSLDISLLQEITMSARRKNTEIMDSQKMDKNEIGLQQKISRKLKFLAENVVSQYRVFLRWEAFEIYNSFLVISECNNLTANRLQNLLFKDPIPFESTFRLTETGFLWYLRCPASHFSHISELLWRICKKIKFYYLDYKNSEFYGLWKGAFDLSTNQWSTDLMKKEKLF
ncbi:MAG TPA: AsnC family protein [Candidatus Bathyarchaeia archaeon]|nr:AsnC family protein [Candidatus Bathyarchaeia archaeon]